MISITAKTANDAFLTLFSQIMENGEEIRGTKALYNVCIELSSPADNLITVPWRKWSKTYAQREWKWYLSQNRSVEDIKKYAPIWDKMHNGDNIVNSNYGWQWNRENQLAMAVIERLKFDKDSRQAWLTIYDGKEHEQQQYDVPCTIAVGFDIHANKLDMTVIMRSCDLIYGFCNDQYCFSQLMLLVLTKLNTQYPALTLGTYTHFVRNLHIYERHYQLNSNANHT